MERILESRELMSMEMTIRRLQNEILEEGYDIRACALFRGTSAPTSG